MIETELTSTPLSIQRTVKLTTRELSAPVEIIYAGTFHLADRDMRLEITNEMVDTMVANFQKLDGPDRVMVNVNHNSDASTMTEARAAGWLQDLYARKNTVDNVERYSLMGVPRWTTDAADAIAEEQFKYLSAEIDFHSTDTLTGDDVGCRLVGVALTNIPAIPKLMPVCLSRTDTNLRVQLALIHLKDRSLIDHMNVIAESFYNTFMETQDETFFLKDLFDNYLIVQVELTTDTGVKHQLFRVDYLRDNEEVAFSERTEWVRVEQVYQKYEPENSSITVVDSTNAANTTVACSSTTTPPLAAKQEEGMDEAKFRELLGIDADADLESVVAALKTRPTAEQLAELQAEIESLKTQLSAPKDESLQQAQDEIATLTRRATAFEKQTETMAKQIEELRQEKTKRDAGDRIDVALRAGRITPQELDAEDGFLRLMAEQDPKTFDKLMATRPARPELFKELGSDQGKPTATLDDFFKLVDAKMQSNQSLTTTEARALVFAEHPEMVALTRKDK